MMGLALSFGFKNYLKKVTRVYSSVVSAGKFPTENFPAILFRFFYDIFRSYKLVIKIAFKLSFD